MSLAEALEPLRRAQQQAAATLAREDVDTRAIATAVVWALLPFLPSVVALAAVFKKSKTMGAYVQLGSIQERQSSRDRAAMEADAVKSGTPRRQMNELRMKDKVFYTVGVMNLAVTPYILGALPHFYYLWYTPKAVVLVALRWWDFRTKGRHYLLYDFCYFANAVVMLYVWFQPNDPKLFQTVFMLSNGPLAWATIAFNHSLIFHSYPHITSLFIHISPMLLTYGLRWSPPSAAFAVCPADTSEQQCAAISILELASSGIWPFYIIWIIGYYVWVFGLLRRRIERRGYSTLYDRVATDGGPFSKILRLVPDTSSYFWLKRGVYMLVHLTFGSLTIVLASLFWSNQAAHTTFALSLLCASAWNAAGFYFQVFSRTYEHSLAKKIMAADQNYSKAA